MKTKGTYIFNVVYNLLHLIKKHYPYPIWGNLTGYVMVMSECPFQSLETKLMEYFQPFYP